MAKSGTQFEISPKAVPQSGDSQPLLTFTPSSEPPLNQYARPRCEGSTDAFEPSILSQTEVSNLEATLADIWSDATVYARPFSGECCVPEADPPADVQGDTIDLPPDLDLPDFDPEARQDAWETPAPDPPLSAFADYPEIKAALKAERILRHLWLPTQSDRDAYLNWLVAVFFSFPHIKSFKAIEKLAMAGLDADLLRSMVELKLTWRRRPEWWMGRQFSAIYGGTATATGWNPLEFPRSLSFRHLRNGQWLLSWRAAKAVCLATPDGDAISFVEALLNQWIHLSPPVRDGFIDTVEQAETNAYLRFIDFIRQRAETATDDAEAAMLVEGLRLRRLIEFPN